MAEDQGAGVPQTLEGYYILHDVYAVDWTRWRALEAGRREEIAGQAVSVISPPPDREGDTALYTVLTQKGDLMLVHYRKTADELNEAEFAIRRTRLYDYFLPSYSYFSVIELGLYELTAMAHKKLADQGIKPGSRGFDAAFAKEMEGQQRRARNRLFRSIPEQKYICFYPMNKRRGEHVNWYTLSMEERRDMMRGHGRIGRKYHDEVTQIIGGSVALDDWEWGVSLHANDMLVFKKLVYEMRFDPASALYAEFGPFYLGIRRTPDQLRDILASV